jgi:hypothetical protein
MRAGVVPLVRQQPIGQGRRLDGKNNVGHYENREARLGQSGGEAADRKPVAAARDVEEYNSQAGSSRPVGLQSTCRRLL